MNRLGQLVTAVAVAIGRTIVEIATGPGWAAMFLPEVMIVADWMAADTVRAEIRIPAPRAAGDPVEGAARSGETRADEASS